MKQTYVSYVALRCVDLDNNYEQLVEHFAKFGLEAEEGFDDEELVVRPAQVDIDADLLRELAKYNIERIFLEAGDCADVAFDDWTTQSSIRILCTSSDIEKIIEVIF